MIHGIGGSVLCLFSYVMDMANLQAIILVEKKGVTFKCLLQKGLDSQYTPKRYQYVDTGITLFSTFNSLATMITPWMLLLFLLDMQSEERAGSLLEGESEGSSPDPIDLIFERRCSPVAPSLTHSSRLCRLSCRRQHSGGMRESASSTGPAGGHQRPAARGYPAGRPVTWRAARINGSSAQRPAWQAVWRAGGRAARAVAP
jgi:hypothetical protein